MLGTTGPIEHFLKYSHSNSIMCRKKGSKSCPKKRYTRKKKQGGRGFKDAYMVGKKGLKQYAKQEHRNIRGYAARHALPYLFKWDKDRYLKDKAKDYGRGALKRLVNVGVKAVDAL